MKSITSYLLLAATIVAPVFAAATPVLAESEIIAEASKVAKTNPEAQSKGYGTLCVRV